MQLSNKFDIRAFHNAILEYGSVPLPVLESNIQQFVNNNNLSKSLRYTQLAEKKIDVNIEVRYCD